MAAGRQHAHLHHEGLARAGEAQADEAPAATLPPHLLDQLACCVVVGELQTGVLIDNLVKAEDPRPLLCRSPAVQAGPVSESAAFGVRSAHASRQVMGCRTAPSFCPARHASS